MQTCARKLGVVGGIVAALGALARRRGRSAARKERPARGRHVPDNRTGTAGNFCPRCPAPPCRADTRHRRRRRSFPRETHDTSGARPGGPRRRRPRGGRAAVSLSPCLATSQFPATRYQQRPQRSKGPFFLPRPPARGPPHTRAGGTAWDSPELPTTLQNPKPNSENRAENRYRYIPYFQAGCRGAGVPPHHAPPPCPALSAAG